MNILGILGILFGIGSLICWIMVLIPLFKEKGPLHGILGILCGLYPFIWGWIHATRLNIKTIMLVWTICFVGSIAVNSMAAMSGAATINDPSLLQAR